MIALLCPTPSWLDESLGYEGQARKVSFFWDFAADELVCYDGLHSSQGNWLSWFLFVRHPKLRHYLKPFRLETSVMQDALVFDRQTKTLHVCPRRRLEEVLSETDTIFEANRLLDFLESDQTNIHEYFKLEGPGSRGRNEEELEEWLSALK
jgi:hypothetical protein